MSTENHATEKVRKNFWQKKQKELTVDDITTVDNDMLKRAVGAAALGNAMEWFDFGVYSDLAVTIGTIKKSHYQYKLRR
nr:DDE transposase [Candidatus Pantoea persica]